MSQVGQFRLSLDSNLPDAAPPSPESSLVRPPKGVRVAPSAPLPPTIPPESTTPGEQAR